MKKLFGCLLTVCLLCGLFYTPQTLVLQKEVKTEQEDLNTIKNRLKETFLALDSIDDGAKVETVYVTKAKEYFDMMQEDGSWDDVDYEAKDNAANGRPWSPYLALDRMQAMAIAYNLEGHELYQKPEVLVSLNKALMHWKSVKPSSTNWWENDIGVNLRFARIGLFLENDLNQESLQVIVDSLNEEGKYQGTGQNNLWYDQNAMYRALITNNGPQLKKVLDECLSYVLVLQTDNQTKEALQVDNSLYFHGVQFYSNGYGLSMFRDVSFWLYHLRDTQYALDQSIIDRMSDYMLDGTRWTIRGDIAELYLGYRPYKYDVNLKNYADEYVVPLQYMMQVDTARAEEYKVLLDNIQGKRTDSGSVGNNYMWRVGYASHMRDRYGVNIKMDSKRIIGGEWRGSWPANQDQGNLIYWSSSAASTYIVRGDEYTSVYPTYDWAHTPGTTTPNAIHKGYANYGRFTNGTDHTIGVSNGMYGSTSYAMSKSSTKANKSYFFFDDEIVALGSGISSTGDSEIHTTLNQVKADNVLVDGKEVLANTSSSYQAKWIYNDNVGYVFPNKTNVSISNGSQTEMPSLWPEDKKSTTPDTFKAWINHGSKPSDDSYAYIVVPNATAEKVENYASSQQITIVANTSDIQAVRHDGLHVTQVNFYKAGTLEYAKGKFVEVDQPCNIIIDESGETTQISLAMTDTDYSKSVNVKLTKDEKTSTTTFVNEQAPYTGQTKTLSEGKTNQYTASSNAEGHDVYQAFDGDENTYWHSNGSNEEWVSKNLNDNLFISDIEIHWTDDRAKSFKIQGSKDGQNFYDVTDVISSKSTDVIQVREIMAYYRVVMLEDIDGKGYGIREIKTIAGENVAKKKAVEVSSTSTNDPGNISSLAVDGNTSTRWSSQRNSNSEWLSVDLAGLHEIYAITVNWEAARSGKYTLETSDDNVNWKVVKTIEESKQLVDRITFDTPIEGSYIRINSSASVSSKYGISIYELEVYGKALEDQIPKENIALHKNAEASSEYENPNSKFKHEAKLAVDGSVEDNGANYQSRWVSNRESKNEWITIDLQDTYDLASVVLNWEASYASDYRIQTSMDNKTFNDVLHIKDGRAGLRKHILKESVATRFIRIQCEEYATKYGYSLWEIEAYGTKTKVDKSALKEVIDSVSKLQATDYEMDSWKELQSVLIEARKLYDDESASQEEVETMVERLTTAIQALVEKVKNINDTYTIIVGESLTIQPTPQNGSWEYDKAFFEMNQRKKGMFYAKAIQVGTTEICYTAPNGATKRATVIIKESSNQEKPNTPNQENDGNSSTTELPSTGESSTRGNLTLLALLSLMSICGLGYKINKRKQKLNK